MWWTNHTSKQRVPSTGKTPTGAKGGKKPTGAKGGKKARVEFDSLIGYSPLHDIFWRNHYRIEKKCNFFRHLENHCKACINYV